MPRKLHEIDYKVRAKREQGKPGGILVLLSQRQRSEWCSGRKKNEDRRTKSGGSVVRPRESVIVFSREGDMAVSEDFQPKKIATYAATHHHHRVPI